MKISNVETIRVGQSTKEFYERDGLAVVGPVVPHYSAGGIGFVATLHGALALNVPMIEYHLRTNPFRDGLSGRAIRHENGKFLAPEGPGLGITPDEKVIERYRLK